MGYLGAAGGASQLLWMEQICPREGRSHRMGLTHSSRKSA